jgi:hypothetical protein
MKPIHAMTPSRPLAPARVMPASPTRAGCVRPAA